MIGVMGVVIGQLQDGANVVPPATTVRAVGLTVGAPEPARAIDTGPARRLTVAPSKTRPTAGTTVTQPHAVQQVARRTSASTPAVPAAAVPAASSFPAEVVRLTNLQRQSAGCPGLIVNPVLGSVAQAHSDDMLARTYFDHITPDGLSPFDRMTKAGYLYSSAAENIAAGYPTPAVVTDGWIKSPGHRANIVNCALKEIGVGYTAGGGYGSYWTVDFGTRR
jgi:uncharacterized protein YkwD